MKKNIPIHRIEVGALKAEVDRLSAEVDRLSGEVGRLSGEVGDTKGIVGELCHEVVLGKAIHTQVLAAFVNSAARARNILRQRGRIPLRSQLEDVLLLLTAAGNTTRGLAQVVGVLPRCPHTDGGDECDACSFDVAAGGDA